MQGTPEIVSTPLGTLKLLVVALQALGAQTGKPMMPQVPRRKHLFGKERGQLASVVHFGKKSNRSNSILRKTKAEMAN